MRLKRPIVCLVLLAGALSVSHAAGPPVPDWFGQTMHPGRFEAPQWARQATQQLQAGESQIAVALFLRAVEADPTLSPAWNNLSVAYMRQCDLERAKFAAIVARVLTPRGPEAARNYRRASQLKCDAPPTAAGAESLDARIVAAPTDSALWIERAASERDDSRPMSAAFFEMVARFYGADSTARLALDLETAGLLTRAGMTVDSPDEKQRLDRERRAFEASVSDVVSRLTAKESALREDVLLQLATVMRARGVGIDVLQAELEELLQIDKPSTFSGAWGRIVAAPGWESLKTDSADEWPALTLRRFPGDTQVVLFGRLIETGEADRQLLNKLADIAPSWNDSWSECGLDSELPCRRRRLALDIGRDERGSVDVFQLGAAERAVFALALVGDSGCGAACREENGAAVRDLLSQFSAPAEPFVQAAATWRLPFPRVWRSDREFDESRDPWTSYPLGESDRIDVPPGIVVADVARAYRRQASTPGMQVWLKGGFRDAESKRVQVGTEAFHGLVRSISADVEAAEAPAQDPNAQWKTTVDVGSVLAHVEGAQRGFVHKFEGSEFAGTWLTMRIQTLSDSYEVVLPVMRGADSLSLLYIMTTLRASDRRGPPPIVDLSSRFAVDYRPIPPDESRVDPREGVLRAGELKVAIPKGFKLSLSSGSMDGFPLTLRGSDGLSGSINRWTGARDIGLAQRRSRVDASADHPIAWQKPKSYRSGTVQLGVASSEADGGRCFVLAVPAEERAAEADTFTIEISWPHGLSQRRWEDACDIVRQSARIILPKKKKRPRR